ncbi:hypothetical protein CRI94_15225 [Longibacter salinarum]|uniref:Uncharacterized protein n=1 Tax=Longibacter salinarum TaxID=1850348 RepID=A0A2A8CU39_9BACT|nr:hypothetical protein CRI94_15225 [Longibacter salinarum]
MYLFEKYKAIIRFWVVIVWSFVLSGRVPSRFVVWAGIAAGIWRRIGFIEVVPFRSGYTPCRWMWPIGRGWSVLLRGDDVKRFDGKRGCVFIFIIGPFQDGVTRFGISVVSARCERRWIGRRFF